MTGGKQRLCKIEYLNSRKWTHAIIKEKGWISETKNQQEMVEVEI